MALPYGLMRPLARTVPVIVRVGRRWPAPVTPRLHGKPPDGLTRPKGPPWNVFALGLPWASCWTGAGQSRNSPVVIDARDCVPPHGGARPALDLRDRMRWVDPGRRQATQVGAVRSIRQYSPRSRGWSPHRAGRGAVPETRAVCAVVAGLAAPGGWRTSEYSWRSGGAHSWRPG